MYKTTGFIGVLCLIFVTSNDIEDEDAIPTPPKAIKWLNNKPRKVEGYVEFDDIMDIELDMEDEPVAVVSLQRVEMNSTDSIGATWSAVYSGGDVLLLQECFDDLNNGIDCQEFGIINGRNKSSYVNTRGQAISIPQMPGRPSFVKPGEDLFDFDADEVLTDINDPPLDTAEANTDAIENTDDVPSDKPTVHDMNKEVQPNEEAVIETPIETATSENIDTTFDSELADPPTDNLDAANEDTGGEEKDEERRRRRKRASLLRRITAAKVVKLIIFADKGLVDRFMASNENNVIAAQQDITNYFKLIVNEMTLHFQTLKEHGRTMSVNGVTVPMDISVALIDVIFPPINLQGHVENFSWLQSGSVQGDSLNFYRIEGSRSGSFRYAGSLNDFRGLLRSYQHPARPFDHAILVTGYSLKEVTVSRNRGPVTSDVLGLAWTNSMCNRFYKSAGLHSSVVEFDARISRTASHEIGHSFGIRHDIEHRDRTNCADEFYIMGQSIEYPNSRISETYSTFSSCSANDLQAHTDRLGATMFEPLCLAPQSIWFLIDFCGGLPGTKLSFDEQCALRYGPGSKRVRDPDISTEIGLLLGFVEQCVADDDGVRFPFLCSAPGLDSRLYKAVEAAPGTKCLGPNREFGNGICYQGRCVDGLRIC